MMRLKKTALIIFVLLISAVQIKNVHQQVRDAFRQ